MDNEITKEFLSETKKVKTYIAKETLKVLCNKEFQLIKGEEVPKGISKPFIKSLINSNLIK